MGAERSERIKELCEAALELEPSEQAALLAQACGGDDELRREVESLLAHEASAEHFIESPAWKAAAREIAADEEATQTPALTGRVIGRYRVGDLVGRGGMGEVYL